MADAVADAVADTDAAAVAAAQVDTDPAARIDALIEEMQVGYVEDSELVPADLLPEGMDTWDRHLQQRGSLMQSVLSDYWFPGCFAMHPQRAVPILCSPMRAVALGPLSAKRCACAIISMHPKISADRLKRVHRMAPANPVVTSVAPTL